MQNYYYFIGISLKFTNALDSGICVLDSNLNIVFLDKFYNNSELKTFLNNFQFPKQSVYLVSLPYNGILLDSKWKVNAKKYITNIYDKFTKENEIDWLTKYNRRGFDILKDFNEKYNNVFRYEINQLKMALNVANILSDREKKNYKFLQTILSQHFKIKNIPQNNMIAASLIDAILGSILGYKIFKEQMNYKTIFEFEKLEVINLC